MNLSDAKYYNLSWIKTYGCLLMTLWQYKVYHDLRELLPIPTEFLIVNDKNMHNYKNYHYSLGQVFKNRSGNVYGFQQYEDLLKYLLKLGLLSNKGVIFKGNEDKIMRQIRGVNYYADHLTAGLDKTRIIVKFYSHYYQTNHFQLFQVNRKKKELVKAYPTNYEIDDSFKVIAVYY